MKHINLLKMFFSYKEKIDANFRIEEIDNEELLAEFESWFIEKMTDFDFAAEFMIYHMSKNYHPHMSCIITSTSAELLEAQKCHKTDKFLRD